MPGFQPPAESVTFPDWRRSVAPSDMTAPSFPFRAVAFAAFAAVAGAAEVVPGATEDTPSLAQYFSWINNTNEGSTEAQTLANLAFFKWLHDEYGMKLDIYAFDAGNIDGPQ